MEKNIQKLLAPLGLESNAFPPESRYHGIEVLQLQQEDDATPTVYLRRRFIAPQDQFSLLQVHRIEQHDRVDNLANQYLGDAQQYWRVCDANGVVHPREITATIGAAIRITLPEGIPGGDHDND